MIFHHAKSRISLNKYDKGQCFDFECTYHFLFGFVWTFTYMLVCYWLMLSLFFFSLLAVQIPNFRMTTLSLKQSLPSFEESVKRRERKKKKKPDHKRRREKKTLSNVWQTVTKLNMTKTHTLRMNDKIFIIQSFIVTNQNVYNPLTTTKPQIDQSSSLSSPCLYIHHQIIF